MKTLMISVLMMVFTLQLSHANEVSKNHSTSNTATRIVREIR
jgi:hypothetical protein